MNNLFELAEQESGLLVFGNNDVIICNWAYRGDGIPRIFAGALISWPSTFEIVDQGQTDDPDFFDTDDWNIVYDAYNDAPNFASSGSWNWYKIKENGTDEIVLVIAPAAWN